MIDMNNYFIKTSINKMQNGTASDGDCIDIIICFCNNWAADTNSLEQWSAQWLFIEPGCVCSESHEYRIECILYGGVKYLQDRSSCLLEFAKNICLLSSVQDELSDEYNNLDGSIDEECKFTERMIKKYNESIGGKDVNPEDYYISFCVERGILQRCIIFIEKTIFGIYSVLGWTEQQIIDCLHSRYGEWHTTLRAMARKIDQEINCYDQNLLRRIREHGSQIVTIKQQSVWWWEPTVEEAARASSREPELPYISYEDHGE